MLIIAPAFACSVSPVVPALLNDYLDDRTGLVASVLSVLHIPGLYKVHYHHLKFDHGPDLHVLP